MRCGCERLAFGEGLGTFQVIPSRIDGMNLVVTHNELQASDRRLFRNERSGQCLRDDGVVSRQKR